MGGLNEETWLNYMLLQETYFEYDDTSAESKRMERDTTRTAIKGKEEWLSQFQIKYTSEQRRSPEKMKGII